MIVVPQWGGLTQEEQEAVRQVQLPAVTRYAQQLRGEPEPWGVDLRWRMEKVLKMQLPHVDEEDIPALLEEAAIKEEELRNPKSLIIRTWNAPVLTHPDRNKFNLLSGRWVEKRAAQEEALEMAKCIKSGLGIPLQFLDGGDAHAPLRDDVGTRQENKILAFGANYGTSPAIQKMREKLGLPTIAPMSPGGIALPGPKFPVAQELGILKQAPSLLHQHKPERVNANGDRFLKSVVRDSYAGMRLEMRFPDDISLFWESVSISDETLAMYKGVVGRHIASVKKNVGYASEYMVHMNEDVTHKGSMENAVPDEVVLEGQKVGPVRQPSGPPHVGIDFGRGERTALTVVETGRHSRRLDGCRSEQEALSEGVRGFLQSSREE